MSDYSLAISPAEVARYQLMAERAREAESAQWTEAGIVAGAVVTDVGCGPAAVSVVMADVVGAAGRVIGVERDPASLATARQVVAEAGVDNVELRSGSADATGLEPSSVDVAVMRHVLAHNGGGEARIVEHLASVVRPGGYVYLVDVDLTAIRQIGVDPDLDDLTDRYIGFLEDRGSDPLIGLRLGDLLVDAGLTLVQHSGSYAIIRPGPGLRPPAWAAVPAMKEAGVVDDKDVARWTAAFERMDERPGQSTVFAPTFSATGRRA